MTNKRTDRQTNRFLTCRLNSSIEGSSEKCWSSGWTTKDTSTTGQQGLLADCLDIDMGGQCPLDIMFKLTWWDAPALGLIKLSTHHHQWHLNKCRGWTLCSGWREIRQTLNNNLQVSEISRKYILIHIYFMFLLVYTIDQSAPAH